MTARTHRLEWDELPAALRAEINAVLGSPVTEARTQRGGYGPSLAARCRLDDGRRVFIKAVSPAQNPDSPAMMRREAAINTSLPPDAPAPRMLHALDDGEWIAMVFEDVEGALPGRPWSADELRRVIVATRALGDLVPGAPLRTVAEHYGPMFVGWRTLVREGPAAVADPWSREHLDELAAMESRWAESTAGDRLVHGDVRSDNVLLTPDGRVVFVDWTSTCTGAGWFDVLAMLPSVELEGGGTPESVLAAAGIDDLERDRTLPLVAAIAGYFANAGRLPDPPGLPTLRDFQRAQGAVTNAWLRRLWDRA